jgi:hypothetical protein
VIGGGLVAVGSPRTAYAVAGIGVLVLVLAALLVRPSLDRAGAPRRELPLSESLGPAPTLETTGRNH